MTTTRLQMSLAAALALSAASCGQTEEEAPWVSPDLGTLNRFDYRVTQSQLSKLDLLFVVDNSMFMADKQELLSAAAGQLVRQLIDPRCVDPGTGLPTSHRRRRLLDPGRQLRPSHDLNRRRDDAAQHHRVRLQS